MTIVILCELKMLSKYTDSGVQNELDRIRKDYRIHFG